MGHINRIPKVPSPIGVNDFMSIKLLKILTIFLANTLHKVVLKIVHKNQYGFLKERNIQDCISLAFEFLFQCESSKREILLLKLDFAMAFDTIDHSAMIKIISHMGFDAKWLQ
jgi:retron-type reverse transcriptase